MKKQIKLSEAAGKTIKDTSYKNYNLMLITFTDNTYAAISWCAISANDDVWSEDLEVTKEDYKHPGFLELEIITQKEFDTNYAKET